MLEHPLVLILISGLAMSAISLIGVTTFFVTDKLLKKMIKPLVALSAGSLLGASFFHLIPESVETLGNSMTLYVLVIVGFLSFFILEQFLHWHHCHGSLEEHSQHRKPMRYLILISDSIHNFIDGVAVGASFIVSPALGWVTWFGTALHEIPQELGDFGVLVHTGWSKKRALFFNFISGMAFILGGLLTYVLSAKVSIVYLLPFTAGNFLYLATVDLVPEINKSDKLSKNIVHFLSFLAGIVLLYIFHDLFHE